MGLPVGKYRTRAGSEMTVSGAHGGISRVDFDWVEERACPDCTPEPYADDDGFLVWRCDECGGGCAALVPVPNARIRALVNWRKNMTFDEWAADREMSGMEREFAKDAWEAATLEWQPIETAPKDRDVLLFCPRRGIVCGAWNKGEYAKTPRPYWSHDKERMFGTRETRTDQPTHWQPLPLPPNAIELTGARRASARGTSDVE